MKRPDSVPDVAYEKVLLNARLIHKDLEHKLRSLSLELQTSYEREKKLLKMISNRDEQLENQNSELKALLIDRGRIARENKELIINRGKYARENTSLKSNLLKSENNHMSSITNLKSEIEQLRLEYNSLRQKNEALSKSKLGSVQLKYWKWKSGK